MQKTTETKDYFGSMAKGWKEKRPTIASTPYLI